MLEGTTVSDLKSELHRKLQTSRASLLSKLEGLSEYDMRRPMTPTGTNVTGPLTLALCEADVPDTAGGGQACSRQIPVILLSRPSPPGD